MQINVCICKWIVSELFLNLKLIVLQLDYGTICNYASDENRFGKVKSKLNYLGNNFSKGSC